MVAFSFLNNFHMNISIKNCLFGYTSTLYILQASTDFKNYMLTKNTFFEKKHLHVQMMS